MKIFRLFAAFTLACFAISPRARAVSPAPDGGYSGWNTAEGSGALFSVNGGTFNTAIGGHALYENTFGVSNTAVGAFTLAANSSGYQNVAVGQGALRYNTTGDLNTANGFQALFSSTTGFNNTATGWRALFINTTGIGNTANGFQTLLSNTDGQFNTACGAGALNSNITGSLNTALGVGAGSDVTMADNVICIGAAGADVSNSCFIGNIRDVTTANSDAIPVLIDSASQLGTMSSSRRFKTDIRPIEKASESILALKPVSFRYKVHKNATPQFGLIAEDVAQVNPDLVIYDADGKPYTVRYDQINAMLLNEFLKEHRTVQEQQKEIDSLKAELKEQRTLIQKVSAQLEVNKGAPQTVVNNQ